MLETQSHNQYANIAEAYRLSKQEPFREFIESPSLQSVLGDVKNLNIIDLACGDGFYARQFKAQGARRVVGVDLSPEMIGLARQSEQEQPLGLEYVVSDAAQIQISSFQPPMQADLVTAVFLLNYARTREQLLAFCKAAYNVLRPGGKFVGLNDSINNPPQPGLSFAKYGFERTCEQPLNEGDAIHYTFNYPNTGPFSFDNFYLKPSTYEWAFQEAGFIDFKWQALQVEEDQRHNPQWDLMLQAQPMQAFSSRRPA